MGVSKGGKIMVDIFTILNTDGTVKGNFANSYFDQSMVVDFLHDLVLQGDFNMHWGYALVDSDASLGSLFDTRKWEVKEDGIIYSAPFGYIKQGGLFLGSVYNQQEYVFKSSSDVIGNSLAIDYGPVIANVFSQFYSSILKDYADHPNGYTSVNIGPWYPYALHLDVYKTEYGDDTLGRLFVIYPKLCKIYKTTKRLDCIWNGFTYEGCYVFTSQYDADGLFNIWDENFLQPNPSYIGNDDYVQSPADFELIDYGYPLVPINCATLRTSDYQIIRKVDLSQGPGTQFGYGSVFNPDAVPGFQKGEGYITGSTEPVVDPENPYAPGGSTVPSTGPGSGTWELGDAKPGVEYSGMDSTATGLYRAYKMTLSEVQNFGAKLWSASILDTLAKHFDNPLDVVIGLLEYPFDVPSGTSQEITFGWIPDWANPLGVTGSLVNGEYLNVSFGSISIPRYSGSFYDFQPYTQAQLYLPYIGFVPLKFSEIVDGTLSINYIVSVTTGIAVAQVTSSKIGVIGTYNCSVGRQLPLNSRDLSGLYMLAAKAAAVVAAGVVAIAAPAVGGALASGAGAEAAGALNTAIRMEGMGINPDPMLNQAIAFENQAITYQQEGMRISNMAKSGAKTFGQSALSGASNANASIQRSGAFDAISGRCSKQKAFILISIPHQNMPIKYAETIGFPSNIGGVLSDFQGYTEVRSIQIKATGATAQELKELESIVRGGIVI